MSIDSPFLESNAVFDAKIDGKAAIVFIEEMTKNFESVQKRVLAEILSQNAKTEYLQRFNLPQGATDSDTFKSNVPLITYEDIKPDIQRIVNGDKSPIFTSQPITEILSSSGTSGGDIKLFPIIHEDALRGLQLRSLCRPVMNMYIPDLDKGKGLYFNVSVADAKTPGGIPQRPVVTSSYKNLLSLKRPYVPYQVFTSPVETVLCVDYFQSMYSQMLCGLVMREDVIIIGATFASNLLQSIRFLQVNWKDLAHDIEIGTLNAKLVTDLSVRESMSKILCNNPNLELAEFIRNECKGENWEGIIPRIWPRTKYLNTVVTGTMAQYILALDYYSGGLPLVTSLYASSECIFGLNLKPLCKPSEISYTIMPTMGYFEFIHYGNDSANSDPHTPYLIDVANLEIGQEYEIVVTTYSGLCRYRMGDILQLTGFHNAAPQLKFVKRKNVVLSICADKTSEEELQKAIENASALLRPYNVDVLEYTSYADIKTIPGHYVIYWEFLVKDVATTINVSNKVLTECCLAIEDSLNQFYRLRRGSGNFIGPLEIRVVMSGTFEKLMHDAFSRGASFNQYKAPRCVSLKHIVELLDSRVVSKHFSPACPRHG